jgi:glycosyltransferase involved in cell wall biosynthesis
MSVYNGEDYLTEAIDSILQQSFDDFEFVIIDDGSVDETPAVLNSYDDPRLKVHSRTNQGQSKALNYGIRLSTGSIIARMDADDVSLPERFQRQVDLLDRFPETGLVGTWCVKLEVETGRKRIQELPENDAAIRDFLVVDNPFIHSSIMMRRSVLDRVGLYDERLIWQDYDLWVRIAGHCEMANIPEPLVIRRKHPGSLTETSKKSREFWELLRIQWKAARRLGLRAQGLAAMAKSLALVAGYGLRGR